MRVEEEGGGKGGGGFHVVRAVGTRVRFASA